MDRDGFQADLSQPTFRLPATSFRPTAKRLKTIEQIPLSVNFAAPFFEKLHLR
jgi:hypothetical protein